MPYSQQAQLVVAPKYHFGSTGSNPIKAWIFLQASFLQLLTVNSSSPARITAFWYQALERMYTRESNGY